MGLVVTTDYVTFYIHKKTEATPSIRGMFGFIMISGKNAYEISQKEFKDFIYFETAKHTAMHGCKDMSDLRVMNTHWILTDSNNSIESIHNSDLINTLLLSDEISVDIELPQEYKDIDICAFQFENEKYLTFEIPDRDYYIDYVLHDEKIEEHQLNVHYFNIEDDTSKSWLFDDDDIFDDLNDDVNDMNNILKIRLDTEKYKIIGIRDFISNHRIANTGNNNQEIYIANKSGSQFHEILESLKNIVIQYNVSEPTPEQKISLYDLLKHSFNVSEGLDLEIGEYSFAIDYAYVVLALGITIRIDKVV